MNKGAIAKVLKKIWCFLPEICITTFLVVMFGDSLYTIVRDGFHLSSLIISIVFAILLACSIGQFFWKKLAISFLYSTLFGFGSVYMTMAVVSEYMEFPAGDPDGLRLLLVGLFLFGGMAFVSFIMPWKYIWSLTPGSWVQE